MDTYKKTRPTYSLISAAIYSTAKYLYRIFPSNPCRSIIRDAAVSSLIVVFSVPELQLVVTSKLVELIIT